MLSWFITSISSSISLFSLCQNDFSIGKSGVLKSPTISVRVNMQFSCSSASFTNFGALVFWLEIHFVRYSSGYINLLLKSICFVYLFPILCPEVIMYILDVEACFLDGAEGWINFFHPFC